MADGVNWSFATSGLAPPMSMVDAAAKGQQMGINAENEAQANAKIAADRATAARQAAAQQAAGNAIRQGDYNGALADQVGGGIGAADISATTTGTANQYSQQQLGLKAAAGLGHMLLDHVPDPAMRAMVIQHNTPLLQAAGVHPQMIASLASDPSDANLYAAMGLSYDPKDQDATRISQQTADNGTIQAQSGAEDADTRRSAEISKQSTPVPYTAGDATQMPYGTGLTMAGSAPGSIPAPGASTPGQPAAGGSSAGGAPLTIRQNNPGALRPDGKSQWQGATGVENGFLSFDSPEDGRRAQLLNISNQQRLHGINTVSGLITKWAPTSDGNNTAAYIRRVATELGVEPNQPLNLTDPTVAGHVADAISRVEAGGTPAKFAGRQGAPAAPAPSGVPGPAGGAHGSYVVDPGTPKADPNAEPALPGDTTKSGPAYLASLPPQLRGMIPTIQAIADGRVPPPPSRSKANMALLSMVTQYDPTYDAANAKSRVATRVDFTSGRSAREINTYNTAIGHASDLYQDVDKLGNYGGWLTSLNGPVNAVRQGLGNTEIGTFRQKVSTYADELESAYRAAGGTEAQINEFQHNLSTSNSPDQIKSVIRGMVGQLHSKLGAKQAQYEQGMGRSDQQVNIISDANATRLKAMGIDPTDVQHANGPQMRQPAQQRPAQSSPVIQPGTIRRGYRYNGGDPANRSSWSPA